MLKKICALICVCTGLCTLSLTAMATNHSFNDDVTVKINDFNDLGLADVDKVSNPALEHSGAKVGAWAQFFSGSYPLYMQASIVNDGFKGDCLHLKNVTEYTGISAGKYRYMVLKTSDVSDPGDKTVFYSYRFKIVDDANKTAGFALVSLKGNFESASAKLAYIYNGGIFNTESLDADAQAAQIEAGTGFTYTADTWYEARLILTSGKSTLTILDNSGEALYTNSADVAGMGGIGILRTSFAEDAEIAIDEIKTMKTSATAPVATKVTPQSGSGEVSRIPEITVEFNMPVSAQNITSAITLTDGENTPVTNYTASVDFNKLTIVPDAMLSKDTPYTLSVNGVSSWSSAVQSEAAETSFRTELAHLMEFAPKAPVEATGGEKTINIVVADSFEYSAFNVNAAVVLYKDGVLSFMDYKRNIPVSNGELQITTTLPDDVSGCELQILFFSDTDDFIPVGGAVSCF